MHVALRLSYDGRFAGYARQPHGGTVEDHVLAALAPEGLVAGSWRSGSRTDRGVAAVANVAACALERPHLRGLVPAVQERLPEGLWLTAACRVPAGWDPRRVASRTYEYLAPGRGEDWTRMREAGEAFVGRHDLRAFARLEEGRDPVREVLQCTVDAEGADWRFRVQGKSFLWNQVRRMVAAVLAVGRAEAGVQDVRTALQTGVPHRRFGLAPAGGLVLAAVEHGLTWDPAAGSVPPQRVERIWQEARAASEVVQSVRAGWRGRPG